MEIKLPELGEGIYEGELVKWLVQPGDAVAVGQSLAEVMTDKAVVELPSAFAGTVSKLHANEGDIVKVGAVLISYESDGAAATAKTETTEAKQPRK